MRRIIHSTTAIVACLSLMAPHIAMAQIKIPEHAAEKSVGKFTNSAPTLKGEQLPANSVVLAQAEEEPLLLPQPGEEAEPAAPADADAAAPAEAEPTAPAEADAAAPAEAKPTAPAEADAAAPAEAEPTAPAEADAAEPAEAEPTAPAEADAAEPAEAEPTAPAEAGAAAPAEAEPTAPAEADAAAPADAEPAAPAEADAAAPAEAEPAAPAEADAAAPAEAEPAAPAEADADTSTDGAAASDESMSEEEGALAEALAEEEAASEQEAQQEDGTAAGQTEPMGEGDLADALAEQEEAADGTTDQEAASQQPADAEGATETDTATGEGGSEAEPATEAASETEVPEVSALNSEAGEGEVTEEQVTEENSRSSGEDFKTSLDDALSGLAGQQAEQSEEDDDSKSDLAKALLLGIGGIAVGSMLSNNREVELSTPDRLVVTRADGTQEVIKDETALLREPGSTVATENFNDGSSRTTVTRADGSRIVTIRDANLRVLRRTLFSADGSSTPLIDETVGSEPVDIASLPEPARPVQASDGPLDEEDLRLALLSEVDAGRHFSLSQIRDISEVRALVAPINIDAITFDTGSAAIDSDQAKQLSTLGNVVQAAIQENPREIFLIEGHTDSVGDAAMNLALSDRRAESVALALSEYFDVPPENLVTQGYGEQFPKVQAEGEHRDNRRASIRRITDLLQTASSE